MAWGLSTPTTPAAPSPSTGTGWGLSTPTPSASGGSFGLSSPSANIALTRQNLSGQVKASQAAAANSVSSIYNGMVGAGNDIIGAFKNAFSSAPAQDAFSETPGKLVNQALTPIVSGLVDAGNGIINGIGALSDNHQTALARGAGAISAGTSAVQAAITPFMSLANAALNLGQHVPAIAPVATGINGIFAAIGQGSKDLAITTLNHLPISQEAKDALAEPIGNAAALAGQLLIGKGSSDLIGNFGSALKDTAHGFANTLKGAQTATEIGPVRSVPVTGESAETKFVSPQAPKTISPTGESIETKVPFANDYREGTTIPVGPKAPIDKTIPVAENSPAETPAKAPPGYAYEPIKQGTSAEQSTAPKTEPATTPTPKTEVTPPATIRPEADVNGDRVTKAASDINEALVKQGIKSLSPEQQSKYTTGSYKDSATKVTSMMTKDIESVKQMARTGEDIPNDVHPQILFNSIEALATKENDVPLLQELARSPLGSKLSEAGSTIGSHGFNDNPNSTVSRIREVESARASAAKAKGVDVEKETTKTVKEGKAEVRKAASTRQTWDDFINQITCKI